MATTKKSDGKTETTGKSGDTPAKKAPAKKPAAKAKKANDNYANPDLRERLKNEIMAEDKGGKPGQWSARKAQLLTHEYEKAGGKYKREERTESQEHLAAWTEQDWRTADGKPADKGDKTARYLPAEAWEKLTPAERKATNAKKLTESKAGKPRTANTKKAKEARRGAE
ncbi:MAG: hypothetical protein H7Z72_12265 [Bacteroidetes bacterium]|nr:hypothetical protein [Fibrella sp.]